MIVGTAGHIDHGKSALVTALTGRPMDRLAEERRRGITIELGFAPLPRPHGDPVGIIDVPGHEDFVRMMVAGASGIDLLLLVVDAQEGVRPQTLEHLAVAEQLRIAEGIPVLTKADLAAPEWLDLVRSDLLDRLARSPIRFAEPAVVSAVTGLGIAELRQRLLDRAAAVPAHAPGSLAHRVRLPVDRVFPVAGVGTVVTGTLWGGTLRVGEEVRVEPGGPQARIRSLESFGQAVAEAARGSRVAVGLVGVKRDEVRRGRILVEPIVPWQACRRFDAVLTLLDLAPQPLTGRTRVRVHHGTAEVLARVYPVSPIQPGSRGPARVVLEEALLVAGGDRVVLRSYSPVTTIGGGWIVDPAPPPGAQWADDLFSENPSARLPGLVLRRRRGMPTGGLEMLAGLREAEAVETLQADGRTREISGRWLAASLLDGLSRQMEERVARHHGEFPSEPGMPLETLRRALGGMAWAADAILDRLVARGRVLSSAGIVAAVDHRPSTAGGEEEVHRVVDALLAAGLEPPTSAELARQLALPDTLPALRVAAGRGLVEAVERDRYFTADALRRFQEALERVGGDGQEITPPALRERLGVSRKYLIPLVEWADRKGITRRDSAGRRFLVKVEG